MLLWLWGLVCSIMNRTILGGSVKRTASHVCKWFTHIPLKCCYRFVEMKDAGYENSPTLIIIVSLTSVLSLAVSVDLLLGNVRKHFTVAVVNVSLQKLIWESKEMLWMQRLLWLFLYGLSVCLDFHLLLPYQLISAFAKTVQSGTSSNYYLLPSPAKCCWVCGNQSIIISVFSAWSKCVMVGLIGTGSRRDFNLQFWNF